MSNTKLDSSNLFLFDNYTLQFEIDRRTQDIERRKKSIKKDLIFIKEAKKELLKRARKEK